MRVKQGDLAVFDSGPRADMIGRFVDVVEFQVLLSSLAGRAIWHVRLKGGPVVACETGNLIDEGFTFDAYLQPIRPPAQPVQRIVPEEIAA